MGSEMCIRDSQKTAPIFQPFVPDFCGCDRLGAVLFYRPQPAVEVFADPVWGGWRGAMGCPAGGRAVKQPALAGYRAGWVPSDRAMDKREMAPAVSPALGCSAGERCRHGLESVAVVFLYGVFGRAEL